MRTLEQFDLKKIYAEFPFVYDVAVIGAGIAGVASAIEAADKGYKVVIIEETGLFNTLEIISKFKDLGCLANTDLFDKDRVDQILKEKNIHLKHGKVISVFELTEKVKKICTPEIIIFSKTVVISSGITFSARSIPNASFNLSTDPMMDVVYYMGKSLAVLGNNSYAFRIAEYFSPLAREVHLIIESPTAFVSSVLVDRVYSLSNLTLSKNKFFDIIGEEKINKLLFDNGDTINVDCVFDCSSPVANSAFIEDEKIFKNGFINVNDSMETYLPGVYATGTCRINSNRMVVSAINDANIVANSIERYFLAY